MATLITEFKARAVEFGGRGIFKKSALHIRDGAGVFERALSSGSFRTVLEIGTYRGVTAAYLANFCDHVITIDLLHGRMEQRGELFDRVAFWRHMGVADKIDLWLVINDYEKRAVIQKMNFDFAFVDGAHDERVALDFELTRRCGRVLFHDADDNGPGRSNCVHEFIRTLPADEVEFMDKDLFAMWKASA